VCWHKLCEVENEYTSEKPVLFAIFVPKSFTIRRNLAKFWQKISLHSFLRHGVVTCWLPYILACKSQNLGQNHAPKVRGDLSAGHKIKTFFQLPKYAISNVPITNNQYLQLFIVSVSRNLRQNWVLGSRPMRTINRRLAGWVAKRIIAHEALCHRLSWVPGYTPRMLADERASMDIWPPPSVHPAALPTPRLPPRFLLLYSGLVEMAC